MRDAVVLMVARSSPTMGRSPRSLRRRDPRRRRRPGGDRRRPAHGVGLRAPPRRAPGQQLGDSTSSPSRRRSRPSSRGCRAWSACSRTPACSSPRSTPRPASPSRGRRPSSRRSPPRRPLPRPGPGGRRRRQLPRADRADEVLVDRTFTRATGLGVGDGLTLQLFSPTTFEPMRTVDVTVTGVGATGEDVAVADVDDQQRIILIPAFLAARPDGAPRPLPRTAGRPTAARAWTSVTNGVVRGGDEIVPVFGTDHGRGDLAPTVVAGRAPVASDEIVLGAETLADLGVAIGGTIAVEGRPHTVVGTAIMPALGPATGDHPTLGTVDGSRATTCGPSIASVTRRAAAPEPCSSTWRRRRPRRARRRARGRPGRGGLTDVEAAPLDLISVLEPAASRRTGRRQPERGHADPMAGLLAAGAMVALGIALGLALGSGIWRRFARDLGVVAETDVPVAVIAATFLTGLVGAVAFAVLPSRPQPAPPAALVLRSDQPTAASAGRARRRHAPARCARACRACRCGARRGGPARRRPRSARPAWTPIVPDSPMPLAPSGLQRRRRLHRRSARSDGSSAADDDAVVGEVRRERVAVVVVADLLEQRLGDALGQAAVHLALGEQRVEDACRRRRTATRRTRSTAPGLGVDLDDADVGAEGERRLPGCSKSDIALERRRRAGRRRRPRRPSSPSGSACRPRGTGRRRRCRARRRRRWPRAGRRPPVRAVLDEALGGVGRRPRRAICTEREPPVMPPRGHDVGVAVDDLDAVHRDAERSLTIMAHVVSWPWP